MPRYARKFIFAGFQLGFTAFAVLFLKLSRLFCVNLKYRCQDTSENVYLLALNRFFGICCFIFTTLEVLCIDLKYCCQGMGENLYFLPFKPVLCHLLF